VSYEEEDTCVSYGSRVGTYEHAPSVCHMRRRIHVCHMGPGLAHTRVHGLSDPSRASLTLRMPA